MCIKFSFCPNLVQKRRLRIEAVAMTNIKQLTSAIAFLASISVLDNFIFVELEPGFESMVLIEPYDSPNKAEIMQLNGRPEGLSKTKDFWIDRHKISSGDFAKFLESTGYEPQVFSNQIGDITPVVIKKRLQAQAGNKNLMRKNNDPSRRHSLSPAGPDDLKVNFKDAQTYCNWLGKVLPSAEQFEFLAEEEHDRKAPSLIDFRCVRNI